MHISLETQPTETLWEGVLQPPQGTKGIGDVRAAIRKPLLWADGQLLGETWQPPLGVGRVHLAKLVFSLNTTARTHIVAAEFCLSLGMPGALIFDAFPREQTVAQDRSVTLEFGPSFKLANQAEVSVGKAATTIDYGRVIPVIHTEGLQSARLCWRYAAHARFPLLGDRVMLAVIALPPGVTTADATLDLTVTCEDRVGPIRLGPPQDDRHQLRWTVGAI